MNFKVLIILICCFLSGKSIANNSEKVSINLIETSDVHGNMFPFNFISLSKGSGSLARVSSFLKEQRAKFKDNCILMDNGDMLQGQPTVYYYNFIDTVSTHIAAKVMNYMKYDLGNLGNHDMETGHIVYDRWISECDFPFVGANIIDKNKGIPYLKPYHIIVKSGVKIAVMGMITPAIPCWLPENLWEGLYFQDMEECAKIWIEHIKKVEKPDVIVGLFHSGSSGSLLNDIVENASMNVAKNVPGFDVVFMGHDHNLLCKKIVNIVGDSVLIADPGSRANNVASINIDMFIKNRKVIKKKIDGKIVNMNKFSPDSIFMAKFSNEYDQVKKFVSERIGYISSPVSAKESFFGPSGFMDLIHDLQLRVSGADISFTAPLSYDSKIDKGNIYVSDMFKLYSYENMLYVMTLSGKEIKNYLEYSYSNWINTVKNENDTLMIIKRYGRRYNFINPTFNFDSAAGINYEVDITKPVGSRIIIKSMSDGKEFNPDNTYKVAINSYRGNGGGELLTNGAGISKDELSKRIIWSTDKDMRFYLMQYIIHENNVIVPQLNNWKFVPEELYQKISIKDRALIFGR